MNKEYCFVAVEFEDDPNVRGYIYWYMCKDESVKFGEKVSAPLGRHNRLQVGTVRHVKFATESGAPYPLHSIKVIDRVIRE